MSEGGRPERGTAGRRRADPARRPVDAPKAAAPAAIRRPVTAALLVAAACFAAACGSGGNSVKGRNAVDSSRTSSASGAPADSAKSAPAPADSAATAPDSTGPVTLPKGIVWTTNDTDPPIGSPRAIRGGTFNYMIGAYPLTFRLMGPNSNDAFAAWNRAFTMDFTLVERHPVTDHFIPLMATAWSVRPDQRTIYFKLDRDARWSDGTPVTADDYVFTWKMMRSKYILDPYYNTYAKNYFQSVAKVDDYTLRIVGTRPSWRPLADYGELWPTPAHAVKLDSTWVDRTTNQPQIAVGPYTVSKVVRGEYVDFQRKAHWWGDDKRYLKGMYNFDRIHLRVIPPERSLDYLRRGELDLNLEGSARAWNEDYDFDAVRKGWIRRSRVFVDVPSGVNGLQMNLEAPIFRNKDFRKAMEYLFNFKRLNDDLMYGEYYRQVSFFEGTPYADPKLKPYPFDPAKAREHLAEAGYHRPKGLGGGSLLHRAWNVLKGLVFTRSNADDVLVDDQGRKARFTLIYGSPGLTRHLTVMQQEYRRAGVDMKLQLLEPGTAFERALERKYEMTMVGWTTSFYPDPRQYLGTEFKNATNNNDVWGFGTPEVDSLIRVYERDMDPRHRRDAMHRIDDIVHDEAFYIPFWTAPFIRLAYWDYLRFPKFYLPKRTENLTDWMVYWIDPEAKARLQEAMKKNEALPPDTSVDKDYYHLKDRLR